MPLLPSIVAGLLALLFSVLSLAQESSSTGQVVDIATLTEGHLRLGNKIAYLADPDHTLTVKALLAPGADHHWVESTTDVPNMGLGVAPHWFTVTLSNASAEPQRGLLAMPYTMMDFLDVYAVQGGGPTLIAQVGDQRPFSVRPLAHRAFLVPLTVPAHAQVRLLVRAESFGALQLPLEFWHPEAFFQQDQAALAAQMIFIGLMLALALYNAFLLVGTRDQVYLWYVLSMVSITGVVLSFHGVLAQFAWPGLPVLNNYVLVGAISANIFAASLFTYYFLEIKRFGRPLRYAFWGHAVAGAVLFALNLFLPYSISIKLVALFSVSGAILGICTGFCLCMGGEMGGRFYTAAWFGLLAGSVVITLTHMGLLPALPALEYSQQVGVAIEGLLLSFALAYRINTERQQRFEAQAEVLRVQCEANEVLEQRVKARTAELERVNRKLRETSATDGLTQVRNRQFFDEKLAHEWCQHRRVNSVMSLVMIDGDHFKRINDTYGHLCGDACLKHLATIFQGVVSRAGDFVARYGGEEFVLLLCHTNIDGAAIVAERVRQAVATTPMLWEGQSLCLTVSIGVSCCRPDAQGDMKTLIRDADEALYLAKRAGRNRVMLYRQTSLGAVQIMPHSTVGREVALAS